ncbi:MAG: hypothetical protein GX829_07265 [Clostridium sp.]|nr:hypothetical protein [Clostridium sp.]
MENLALIYIGGNTTRFALWEIHKDRSYRLIESFKENLKLGGDILDDYTVSEEKIDALLKIIRFINGFSVSMGAEHPHIILSEFFDRIKNKDDISRRLQNELFLDIIDLSDEEELNLDYLALKNSMRIEDALIVDISGGSTSLAYIRDGELKERFLLPFGTLNLTEKFNLHQVVSKDAHENLEAFLKVELDKVPWLNKNPGGEMIILGGSARAISKIDRKKRRYPMNIIHEYEMQKTDIKTMYLTFLTKTLKQRYSIEGLDKDRADILPGALSILNAIIEKTEIDNLRVSGVGIREGFLFYYLIKKFGELPNMLDRSIQNILKIHSVDQQRASKLYTLTRDIYISLNGVHKIWPDWEEILKTSAMLRDVGLSVRYYNHDAHNFYIISNAEINGMDHRQIIMAALAATFTNGIPKDAPLLKYGQIINRLDLKQVFDMGICLSIAEKLLRSSVKEVKLIHVDITSDEVKLCFESNESLQYEIYSVLRLHEVFYELYGKNLSVCDETENHS